MSAPAVPATPAAGATPAAERRRGYHRWTGERGARAWRWWVIARGNMSLAVGNNWVKFVLAASLIPGIILAGITYFFLPLSAVVLDSVMDASLIFVFLLAALVGARMVSEDRRQGAFLAHFSRPVTRLDYMAGKFAALAIPTFFVATVSGYVAIGADMSVDSETMAERLQRESGAPVDEFDNVGYLREASYLGALGAVTWWGLVVAATTTGIVLGLSSLTTRARIAGVAWFALVAFGAASHGILSEALEEDWPATLSWMDGLGDLSSHLLGIRETQFNDQDLELNPAVRFLVLAGAAALGLAAVNEQLRRAEGGVR